ncbi:MAG: S-layer homology domain-containing protein, partial [Oscillospiraceae bacterium]
QDLAAPFTDMQSHWAKDDVAFTSARGLFAGTAPKLFSPTDDMTRGMMVTVLHRLENEVPASGAPTFGDVKPGVWYSDAVSWAAANQIVSGNGKDFGAEDDVTREQLAAMLFRYAGKQGLDTAGRKSLSGFSDASAVSAWAVEPMRWAVATGIFSGNSDGTLNGGGNASRAEVAAMMERFITSAAKQR